ncbi:MAG: DUF3857 domain-containing protein [Bacteroidales bacterium]|nr:DUF3857 domain-containing protein [Bacteroidales bacterium]
MDRLILSIFLFCWISLYSHGQEFPAELIRQETSIHFDDVYLLHDEAFEIQVNNRAGERFTKVQIPYSRMVKITDIQASITDTLGKTIKKLSKSDITERSNISEISLYEDHFIKEFTLKHNIYPYRLRYSYTYVQKEFLQLEEWTPVLSNDVPTRLALLKVDLPVDFKIAYIHHNTDSFRVDSLKNSTIYHWRASYSGKLEEEKYAPSAARFQPQVSIMPLKFTYEESGSSENWQFFGRWQASLLKDLNDLPEDEIFRIHQLVMNMTDKKAIIRKLYHFLQDETRYINISIKTGGFKPYPASYVAKKKYGDCKALSVYFRAILDEVGIPSFYTKINAGTEIEPLDRSFPSQQFNHIILCVPIEQDTLWLDCTSIEAFDYQGTFIQNRDVLVVNGNRSFLSRIPALQPFEVLNSRTFHVSYQEEGNITTVGIDNIYRGNEYTELLNYKKFVPENILEKELRKRFNGIKLQLDTFQLMVQPRDSTFIQLKANAITDEIFKYYGKDILVNLIPFEIQMPEKNEKRRLPLQIDFPIYKTDTLYYALPPHRNQPPIPDNILMESEFGEYGLSYNYQEGNLRVIKTFLLNQGNYPRSSYKAFYEFITKIISYENSAHIVLQKP